MNRLKFPPFVDRRALVSVCLVSSVVFLGSCASFPSSVAKSTALDFLLSPVSEEFPLNFYFTDVPGSFWRISYTEPEESDETNLVRYLTLLSEELAKHPDALRDASRMQNVVIVKNLAVSGQKRSGVPDYYRNTLYLDFNAGSYNSTYQRHIIHHEFYHIIEQKVNGNAYWKDPQWAAFNEPGFQYGDGGASAQSNSRAYLFTHPQIGFANEYSMSAVEEDKAEIFAALFTPGEYEKIIEWAKSDAILAAKIDYMKAFLNQICPEIDDEFWMRIHPPTAPSI